MSPDAPRPDLQAAPSNVLLAGRYQILDKLGEGGMGSVFRARDNKLNRLVAVKLLPTGSTHDDAAVARFGREARAPAHLSHPGIIQAFDSGQDHDKHFLVMEFLAGRSLAREMADKGRLTPCHAADYIHQAALALQHAHQHGLVHRDVKPSNLLVSTEGQVKLLDLGLARFLQDQIGDGTLTREGVGMGTPDYAAPEQFRDAHKADTRSDIYSLGCTLYHLIAGRVPFPGSSLSEKMKAHETKEATPLEELCPEMPGGLALLVQRMMAKRPADRFQGMAEVAEALAPYVVASSPSFRAIRTTSTWTGAQLVTMTMPRRRTLMPWLITGVAAALVLVLVGLVGLAGGWFRANEPPVAQRSDPVPVDSGKETGPAETGTIKPPADPENKGTKKPAHDPNVLTVSQKKEGGGTYRTLRAALEVVKPGETIRVLDNAIYHEQLSIRGRTKKMGITLEAVAGATLEATLEQSFAFEIIGLENVTIRGFRLRATKAPHCALVVVRGDCPGLRLERLQIEAVESFGTNGVEWYPRTGLAPAGAPAILRACEFRGLADGIIFLGEPEHCLFRAVVRECLFTNTIAGILLIGGAREVQVVGNRFRDMSQAAVQFQFLSEDSEDILVANNTSFESVSIFRHWDGAVKGKRVQICNNLVLGNEDMDMRSSDAINATTSRGPGNGLAVAEAYHFSHNWREGKKWGPGKGWIPPDPKKADVLKDKIDGVNRDPKSLHFLRPDRASPLATAGAGNDNPSLPRYIGALPPVGVEPWDWDSTWRAFEKKTEGKN